MTSSEWILAFVLVVLVLAWIGMAVYILAARCLHERERRLLVRGAFRRLSRSQIESLAANRGTSAKLAEALSNEALARYPERLVERAEGTTRDTTWSRVVALRVLGKSRSPFALRLFEAALESDEESVVAAAVTALGERTDAHSSLLLVRALRAGRLARSRVASQLEQAPGRTVEMLAPLLDDPDPVVRFWGATLLGSFGADARAVQALLTAADDADASVRAGVVEAIAGSDEPEALAVARRLTFDSAYFVRAHAARTLGSFDRDDIVPDVARLLGDTSWWVRAAAKETLQARPRAAAGPMIDLLEHPDLFARNGAAEVLQNIGMLDRLIAAAPADRSARRLLARVLLAGGPRLAAMAAERSGLQMGALEELAAAS
jgi:HEAT repeat protein